MNTEAVAGAVAVNGNGQSLTKDNNISLSSTTRRRKYPGWTEQNDHCRLKSNSVKVVSEKENKDNYDDAADPFLSPPPNKNKNMVSAPKKKNKNLLRTVLFQHRSSSSSYDPMTYYHKTPSSTLMELPPCTPLLEFNSKMEYRATPRVLLEQFDDGSGTAVSSLGITAGDFGRIASLLEKV
ncbi:hypothetical protein QTG54_010484 [Skeletonema marinoi]|uniref:Uncharacterized protein n=1 Tax=Skeletonema marinoi TaxID=267567 RepID=A0AAD9DB07_9STRA|nr:hypothetical protein QTG54_010484 [Skeletonema marinoi]